MGCLKLVIDCFDKINNFVEQKRILFLFISLILFKFANYYFNDIFFENTAFLFLGAFLWLLLIPNLAEVNIFGMICGKTSIDNTNQIKPQIDTLFKGDKHE
jgi:hypothetical protein